ncbi:MAG: hypothetical protein K1060chlam2_00658 [Chlamydiae bacterium]|nr:hypothetical protein [Chlamydiota bacterium]
MNVQTIEISPTTKALFVGPPLEEGPLPTLFYFALSAEDSLQKDPYNQPVQFLDGSPFRIFSITLPGHENNLPPEEALSHWKEGVIPAFIGELKAAVDFLSPHFKDKKLAVAGLSRGAFIACHLAAVCPQITHILGFAPLTKPSVAEAFQGRGDAFLDLENLIPKLYDRTIRFYIGNCDIRVGTEHAFSLIHNLAKAARESNIISPPIELIIGPSTGHRGHGTSPEVFRSGVDYLKESFLKT